MTGVFRSVVRETYDDQVRVQNELAREQSPVDDGSLQRLLNGHDTWTVGE